ncbi:hypothetical protein QA648_15525 [Rhizobium sp. CB3171]|nr:hypothetical protein [Rhizobium sp. CB3171]WFU01523.1 hypothetical protein QA648_15525 [Rhizobium sp. CB3171]
MAKKNLHFFHCPPESPRTPGFVVWKIAKDLRATYQGRDIFIARRS